MRKRTNRAFIVAVMATAFWLSLASAHAHFDFDLTPDVPGVGEPRGVYGLKPEVEIQSRRTSIRRGRWIPIAVECFTSTGAGCNGTLELSDRAGRRTFASFELDEGQAWTIFLALPADAKRFTRTRAGWKAIALATIRDSLGREGSGSTVVRVADRHRRA